jgi:rhodanese-related sulfurtransferase
MQPSELVQRRSWKVVDIRPANERFGGLGFLPGSIHLPIECRQDVDGLESYVRDRDAGIVIYCTSGRRSLQCLPWLEQRMFSQIDHLEGGLLNWRAESFPTCFAWDQRKERISTNPVVLSELQQFPQLVKSCFVAEAVENSLDGVVELDFEQAQRHIQLVLDEETKNNTEFTYEGMLRILNRISELAWHAGFPLEKIEYNVERMLVMLMPGVANVSG